MTRAKTAFSRPELAPVMQYDDEQPGKVTGYTYCGAVIGVCSGSLEAMPGPRQERELATFIAAPFYTYAEISNQRSTNRSYATTQADLVRVVKELRIPGKGHGLFLAAIGAGILEIASFGPPKNF